MPQSLTQVILHVVFSTKDRRPLIRDEFINELHAYLATLIRERGGECYRAGGVDDHVHIAILLPRTESLADLVGHIKRNSSKWIHNQKGVDDFAWQAGYGAFSVSPQHLSKLTYYIDGQKEHHQKISFQDEYRTFLNKYGVVYDER
jgi:putative transposase